MGMCSGPGWGPSVVLGSCWWPHVKTLVQFVILKGCWGQRVRVCFLPSLLFKAGVVLPFLLLPKDLVLSNIFTNEPNNLY